MSSETIVEEDGSSSTTLIKSPSGQTDAFVNLLYVWPEDWDLPSLDPECLVVMCYLKYAKLSHKIIHETNSFNLVKNNYPRLEYNNKVYVGIDEILDCLKSQKNIDSSLSDNAYADMFAFLNLFKLKFIPAFNALCWLDEENTYKVIRSAYGRYLRFPFSLIKLKQMANKIERSIMCNFKTTYVQYEEIKQLLLNDAKECLNEISYKLNDGIFSFENRPSLIDAYLFGYLSILNKAPFQSSTLKAHLIACSNLTSLAYRINKDIFPNETNQTSAKKTIDNQSTPLTMFQKIKSLLPSFISSSSTNNQSTNFKTTNFEQNENWEKRKQQMIAVGIAVTAMFLYAISIGFIKIDIIKHDLEYTQK